MLLVLLVPEGTWRTKEERGTQLRGEDNGRTRSDLELFDPWHWCQLSASLPWLLGQEVPRATASGFLTIVRKEPSSQISFPVHRLKAFVLSPKEG